MQKLEIGFLWQANFVSCSKSNGSQARLIVASTKLQFYLRPPFSLNYILLLHPVGADWNLGREYLPTCQQCFLYSTPQQRDTLTPDTRQISFTDFFFLNVQPYETLIYHKPISSHILDLLYDEILWPAELRWDLSYGLF